MGRINETRKTIIESIVGLNDNRQKVAVDIEKYWNVLNRYWGDLNAGARDYTSGMMRRVNDLVGNIGARVDGNKNHDDAVVAVGVEKKDGLKTKIVTEIGVARNEQVRKTVAESIVKKVAEVPPVQKERAVDESFATKIQMDSKIMDEPILVKKEKTVVESLAAKGHMESKIMDEPILAKKEKTVVESLAAKGHMESKIMNESLAGVTVGKGDESVAMKETVDLKVMDAPPVLNSEVTLVEHVASKENLDHKIISEPMVLKKEITVDVPRVVKNEKLIMKEDVDRKVLCAPFIEKKDIDIVLSPVVRNAAESVKTSESLVATEDVHLKGKEASSYGKMAGQLQISDQTLSMKDNQEVKILTDPIIIKNDEGRNFDTLVIDAGCIDTTGTLDDSVQAEKVQDPLAKSNSLGSVMKVVDDPLVHELKKCADIEESQFLDELTSIHTQNLADLKSEFIDALTVIFVEHEFELEDRDNIWRELLSTVSDAANDVRLARLVELEQLVGTLETRTASLRDDNTFMRAVFNNTKGKLNDDFIGTIMHGYDNDVHDVSVDEVIQLINDFENLSPDLDIAFRMKDRSTPLSYIFAVLSSKMNRMFVNNV